MKTLRQYEDELTTGVESITLLGQLGYDQNDLERLRAALRPLFTDSPGHGLRVVGDRYHRTFALYLVLEGIYQYTGGNYWAGPTAALGLGAANHREEVGAHFRVALRAEGLPTFEHLGGHVHIAPILAHGGIPNYCLDDYFDLLDWAERHRPAADAPALLDEWARGGFPVAIDRPAQRFLLHGGDVAEEFVERCLLLLRDEGDPESLDLPARVLERYEMWRQSNPAREKGRQDFRLGRPKLIYDPYGEGVAILLPPIFYRAGKAPERVMWQITTGARRREEKTWARRLGDEVEFMPRAAAVNVLTVAPDYKVVALADGAPLREWTLAGPGALPLLAFDCHTGELLADRQRESRGDYWITPGERVLVFPREWTATADGGRKLAELPDPGGGWDGYAFESWLLEPDGRVTLSAPDARAAAFRARNDPPPAQPYLDGEPLVAAGLAGGLALYNGRPPLLHIPPGRAAHDPAKWYIDIMPVGVALPPTRRAFLLADLPRHCVMVEGEVLLSLDAPELLGPSPMGEFRIHLRGPYGRQRDFAVGFAPGLRFAQDPPLHLAPGDEPTRLRVSHAAGYELLADDPLVTVGPVESTDLTGSSRTVTAAAKRKHVSLRLEAAPHGNTTPAPAIAFDLPVYRLRFGLVEPEQPDRFQWATTPIRLHPEALEATHTASIHADLPLPPETPPQSIGWRLMTREGRTLRETTPRHSSRHPETGLAEWLDTFREEGDPALLQLVLVDDASGAETAIEIARLLPTLELGQVMTSWHMEPDGDRLSLVWESDNFARNRQVRLWPVDGPWVAQPRALAVPDDAQGWAEWTLPPGTLPPGEYLAEMVIHDPWDPSEPTRPAADAPNLFTLRPDDMAAAVEAARDRARRDELSAEDALAWMLYLTRTGTSEAIARFNITLWRNRAALSIGQLLLWADATRAASDETAYRIAQKALFEGPRLAEFIRQPEPDRRAACLAHLSGGQQADVYRELLPITTDGPRRLCLRELCRVGDETGYSGLLADVERAALDVATAVEMLLPSARRAADYLYSRATPAAYELLLSLLRQAHDARFISKGDDLQTNAGYMRVTGMRDAQTRAPLDVCLNNGEPFLIIGKLWPATSSLPVQIDLAARSIQILQGPIYRCEFSGEPRCDYVFGSPKELKRHYQEKHRMVYRLPQGQKILTLDLTHLSKLPREGF